MPPEAEKPTRVWIARAFTAVEDLVYIGLGLLLAGSAIVLLVSAILGFGQSLFASTLRVASSSSSIACC